MTITKTIGSAGGRDYATLQAAWDALPSTFVDDYIFELYNDSKFTARLLATGKSPGSYTVTFRAAAGQGFRDHPNRLTNALRFDPANGVAIESDQWSGSVIEGVSPFCVILDGLQVKNTNTSTGVGVSRMKLVKNCIIDATGAVSNRYVAECLAQNSILIQRGTVAAGTVADVPNSSSGNIIIAPNGSSAVGMWAEWDVRTAANNVVIGFATPFATRNSGSYSSASDYNATDKAATGTGQGTHNVVSLTASDLFVSVNPASLDLRIKAGAAIIGAGVYDAALDPDILNQARANPPTIGAMEYAAAPADTTAPTLSSPAGTKTGTTTASGSISTDEGNGTMYAVVSVSATKPTPTQIQAGQSATGGTAAYATSKTITATGVQSFSATGLTAATTYYWHYQHKDAAGNDSVVATSAAFTTDASNAPPTFSGTIANISGTQGVALTNVDVSARFTDTDALTYTKIGTWPAGVTLTGSVIGGTPTVSGTFASLKVRATDTASQFVESNAFTITLAAPPTGAIDLTAPTYAFKEFVTGALLASKPVTFWLHNATTGALIATISGSTNASGIAGMLTDAAIQPATQYRLDYKFASGEYGVVFITSAA